MTDHECKFESTGEVRYSNPLQFRERCSICEIVRYRMEKSLIDKTIVYVYEETDIDDADLISLFSEIQKRL